MVVENFRFHLNNWAGQQMKATKATSKHRNINNNKIARLPILRLKIVRQETELAESESEKEIKKP